MKPTGIPAPGPSAKQGFTLTELLVVLATIAMLALPLLAITTKDQLLAQQLQCASNLKQLRVCSMMYVADTGVMFGSPGAVSVNNMWPQRIQAYNANVTNMVMCPAAVRTPPIISSRGQGSADQYWIDSIAGSTSAASVGFNGWFYSDKGGDGGGLFTLRYFAGDSTVAKPPLTPVFFDENWMDAWPAENDAPCKDLYQGRTYDVHANEIGRLTIVRHGGLIPANASRSMTARVLPGAVNIAFYDGHVELVKLENLWTLYWYVGCQPPTSGHPRSN